MRRARPTDAPTATVLTLSAHERRRPVVDAPAAPARIIVFPGLSLLHLQELAASTRASEPPPRR